MDAKRFQGSAVALNYVEGPPSGPPLVLVHGHGLRWQTWAPILPELTKRWHVYAVDLRGHGHSDHAEDGAYLHEDYVADLVEFMNAVVVEPAYVVGHSMGGLVASGVAAHPEAKVRGLVLEDSPFFLLAFGVPGGLRESFEGTRSVIQNSATPEQIAEGLLKYGLNDDPSAAAQRGEDLFRVDPHIFTAVIEADAVPIDEEQAFLASIPVPTLFMVADPDAGGILGYFGGTAAAEIIPLCRVVNVPGAGHYVHRERPSEFVKLVEEFFD